MKNDIPIICLIILNIYLVFAIPQSSNTILQYNLRDRGNASSFDSQNAINVANNFATTANQLNMTWLQWSQPAAIADITDLGEGEGLNYISCDQGKVMVGIKCANKYCNTLTPTCAILQTIGSKAVDLDQSRIPTRGSASAISAFADYFSDGTEIPYRYCANGSIASGISCHDTDCKYQSLYCGEISQPAGSDKSFFMAPPSPLSMMTTSQRNPAYCSWEGTATIGGDPAICPPNKVIAGLYATGKRSSALQILCCPVYELNPVDCQYTEWVSQNGCVPKGNSTCGNGIQTVTRTIVSQPKYLGKECASRLESQQPCYVPCNSS